MSRLKGYTQIIKHAELHVVFRRGNKNSGQLQIITEELIVKNVYQKSKSNHGNTCLQVSQEEEESIENFYDHVQRIQESNKSNKKKRMINSN